MKQIFGILFWFLLCCSLFPACNNEEYITDSNAGIQVSTDTVTFDTIFTTIGSVTKSFRIYNTHDKFIKIAEAYLAGGESSNYRISIDGENGRSFKNIVIAPGDSLWAFVEVTLDPVNSNLPLVVEDAIVINCNNSTTRIVLEAFGQDVHFYNGKVIETETWKNDKPYLIYRNLVIDEGHTLTIEKGARVYFHYNSSIVVYGSLQVNGTFEDQVIFEGDRFDYGYDKSAGRWGTIFFLPESEGKIEYGLIRNANAGLQVGYPNEDNETVKLELINTQIINSSWAGIIAFNATINAYNCIIGDSKYHGMLFFLGGKYNFYHCSISIIGAYSLLAGEIESYSRSSDGVAVGLLNFYYPFIYLDNNYYPFSKTIDGDMVEANFYNSIIFGRNKREFDTIDNKKGLMNFYLENCLVKSDSLDITNTLHCKHVILNQDPRFKNDSTIKGPLDYALDTLSPAKDVGSMEIINRIPILKSDYEGKSRIADGKPDLGAIERVE